MKAWLKLGALLMGLITVMALGRDMARAAETRMVVDAAGREVAIPYPVKRIIVTDDTIADAVRIFGKQDLVVGIEDSMPHRGYFPVMSRQPAIGNQWAGLNWEYIVALKPDVILVPHHPSVTPRVTAEAARLNLPILAIRWHYANSMDQAARILGQVLGEPERAARFIKWRHGCIDQITERLKDLPPHKRVDAYVEIDISGPIGRAAGKGTPSGETLALAGLNNICQFQHNKEVSPEWLMDRDPQLVIMNDYGGKSELTGYLTTDAKAIDQYLAGVKNREKFKRTRAVKDGKVYLMNSKMRGSMHMVGALYMAKSAYPERFADIEPRDYLRELFEQWMGLPCKGIWFHPANP